MGPICHSTNLLQSFFSHPYYISLFSPVLLPLPHAPTSVRSWRTASLPRCGDGDDDLRADRRRRGDRWKRADGRKRGRGADEGGATTAASEGRRGLQRAETAGCGERRPRRGGRRRDDGSSKRRPRLRRAEEAGLRLRRAKGAAAASGGAGGGRRLQRAGANGGMAVLELAASVAVRQC